MTRSVIYLNDTLTMPNGAKLYAEDICVEVDGSYDIRTECMFSPPRDWDWDFDVVAVRPFYASDASDDNRVVKLALHPDHPAIQDLVKRHADDIIEQVQEDAAEDYWSERWSA